ncbi:MAG: electron transfer flavoprotein subunit beta/FixA family protein [Syntrophobacter sp.]
MKIVVIIKQTPDTETAIRIAPSGGKIETSGIKWIINPYDEFAIEAALRLKQKHGGTITAISLGPQRAVEALRTALALGVDDAMLVEDPAMKGADYLQVTRVLAAAVKERNADLILMGSRAVDYDQGQRGVMLAERLGWPHLPLAVSLESDGSKATIERPIEGGKVTLEAPLPALITFGGSHAVWNPRYASPLGIVKARKKPVDVKKLADLGFDPADFGIEKSKIRITSMELPPPRKPGKIIDGGLDTAGKAKELARLLREEAGVI